jgi:hypothetical protein
MTSIILRQLRANSKGLLCCAEGVDPRVTGRSFPAHDPALSRRLSPCSDVLVPLSGRPPLRYRIAMVLLVFLARGFQSTPSGLTDPLQRLKS